jgi:hypothetical protein
MDASYPTHPAGEILQAHSLGELGLRRLTRLPGTWSDAPVPTLRAAMRADTFLR